jgi:protein tyrosine/serine phosphatase
MKDRHFRPAFFILAIGVGSLPVWAASPLAPGVSNFYQVNERVYRGAQPTDEGWTTLAGFGIKTVVDLRRAEEHSTDAEKRAVEAAGMRYINIPMNGMAAPSDGQISKLLALLDSPSAGPIFVHCRRGADRTGTVIACYRIAHDGWENRQALQEAKSNGMSWMELSMKRYIMAFKGTVARVESGSGMVPAVSVP